MPERVRIHYHRPGKGTTVFQELVVETRPDVWVTLLPLFEGPPTIVNGRTVLESGAAIVWFVFPDGWRDVGRFHLLDGTFTGWYTNFRRPTTIGGSDWFCSDLFLDHWLPVRGSPRWLDDDELRAARRSGLVDEETVARIAELRSLTDEQVRAGTWPPAVTREIGLDRARHVTGS